jgi:regulator of RNase E activity RraB
MNDSNPVVIKENWETYSYRAAGVPIYASFYAGAKEIVRDEYPFCARVIIPVNRPNSNGGPTDEEADTLWRLEDDLTEILASRSKCLLVGRLTHGGHRELVFQVSEWDTFRPPAGYWMKQNPEYDIDVSEHDGWQFFDGFLWPDERNWMLIFDRRVVDNLIKSGSDPQKEHSLEFVFRGDKAQLKRLAQELTPRGYLEVDSPESADQIVMAKKLSLDLQHVWSESLENQRLCEEFGVEYDGWGANVVS